MTVTLTRAFLRRNEVPLLVEKCVVYLEQKALDQEGLFRVAGSSEDVSAVRAAFDNNLEFELEEVTDDHNVVASVLKAWIRDQPEPIIPKKQADLLVTARSMFKDAATDENQMASKVAAMRSILMQLPVKTYNLVRFLFSFFRRVVAREEKNKMGIDNLATVFAPNLTPKEWGLEMYSMMFGVFRDLVLLYEPVFRR